MASFVDKKVFSVPIFADLSNVPPGLERIEPLFESGTPGFLYGAGERVVVLFHGNAQSVTSVDTVAFASSVSRACGARVALVEYPGFWDDENNTEKTVAGMYSACLSAVRVLKQHFGDVHIVGYSVGTAPAARVCAEAPEGIASLTLVAPMVSALSVLEDHVPGLRLISPLSRTFDTLCVSRDAAKTRGKRVLVVHGEDDKLIHPRHGKRVSDVYKKQNPETLFAMVKADHGGIVSAEQCIALIRDHVMGVSNFSQTS